MAVFTILRFEKLKSRAAIRGSSGHMTRSIPALNADSTRTASNRVLVGSADPLADVDRKLAGAETRKNSVLAIEVLISASPEWFSAATQAEKADWVRSSRAWLAGHFGAANIAHLQLHVDESTPHLTGFIVPKDTSGRLNAARWMDGSKKLAAMQTGYTKAVAHLGLERGIEGSKATHVPLKHVRGGVKDPTDLKEMRSSANRTIFAERKLREAQDTMVDMRDKVEAVRDVPLQDVAENLGLARMRKDRASWVDDAGEHKLSINGGQWYDHKKGRGGGGAIDLAMHVLKAGFREAVAWCGLEMGKEEAARAVAARAVAGASQEVAAAVAEALPFNAPENAPGRLQGVLRYLRGRGIAQTRLGALVASGRLYADPRGNAVFLAKDAGGRARGAEIRGTGKDPFHGHAPGSSRKLPWMLDNATSATRVVLCESAIDAMSYAQLGEATGARIVSTGGARPTVPSAVMRSVTTEERWTEVVVAYDNDQVGHEAAERVMEELRQAGVAVRRHVPAGKDWNDDLVAMRAQASPLSFSQQNGAAGVSQQGAAHPAEGPSSRLPRQ